MKKTIIIFLTLFITQGFTYAEEISTEVWDVLERYGAINGIQLQNAVNDAISYQNKHKDITIILSLKQGKYRLEKQINFRNMNIEGKGWLIVQGQGIGVTELVDTDYNSVQPITFRGITPHRLKFSDFSLSGSQVTSSQGTVVGIGTRYVDIKLDPGFPTPVELYATETTQANKLLLIDDSNPDNPHFVEGPDNDHYFYRILWFGPDRGHAPTHINDRVWRFYTNQIPPYQAGNRIAISSKAYQTNWGYFRDGGSDIVFENIVLKRLGRIKFRQDGATSWENIRFTNISIKRHSVKGLTAFYSTDAGPQFGQDGKGGGTISNLIVENCDFRGVTDDGSAFQHVLSGRIRNNIWEDGRVLVGASSGSKLIFSDNIFYHSPLEDLRKGRDGYKGAYNFSYSSNEDFAILQWKAGTGAQLHDVYFGSSNPPKFVGRIQESTYITHKLEHGVTYYWKVNEYNKEFGINKGDIQSFIFQ